MCRLAYECVISRNLNLGTHLNVTPSKHVNKSELRISFSPLSLPPSPLSLSLALSLTVR